MQHKNINSNAVRSTTVSDFPSNDNQKALTAKTDENKETILMSAIQNKIKSIEPIINENTINSQNKDDGAALILVVQKNASSSSSFAYALSTNQLTFKSLLTNEEKTNTPKPTQQSIVMYQNQGMLEEIFGELPKGSKVVESTSDYCIFITNKDTTEGLGFQTIRFKVETCYLRSNPDDSRTDEEPSEMTLAMRQDNNIIIVEGTHRVIHAFQGGIIPPGLGGIVGKPNILEYIFDPETPENFFEEIIPISKFTNYVNPYRYA